MKNARKLVSIEIPIEDNVLKTFARCFEEVVESRTPALQDISAIGQYASSVLKLIIANERPNSFRKPLKVELFDNGTALVLDFHIKSTPLFLDEIKKIHPELIALEPMYGFELKNQGRSGQRIRVKFDAPKKALSIAINPAPADGSVEIRRLKPGEENALSKLFYNVYGYSYISENVYFPERIAKMIRENDLVPTVAAIDDRLLGHVGLVRRNTIPPIYEAALGVVDPIAKSLGLFGRLFKETMRIADETDMVFSVYDFVTNHDHSQRLVAKYGIQEMAIFVGSQCKETQVNLETFGIGKDAEDMDRYSVLLAIKERITNPFGNEVILPMNFGELAEFLLEPLGIEWKPAARFFPLAKDGTYRTIISEEQKSVLFDLLTPGQKAIKSIIEEWRYFLRKGFQYCAVETSLNHPGIGQLHDILGQHGFFIAGFVPYHMSQELGFRFQSLGPTRVAFDDIKVSTVRSKKLLQVIREDYERKALL